MKLIFAKKTLLLLLVCLLTPLWGCSDTVTARDPEEAKVPVPADYTSGDLDYCLNVTDGCRSVSLQVARRGKVTTARVTSPEELAGLQILRDGQVTRLSLKNSAELTLTPEAAAGLNALFCAMETPLSPETFSDGFFALTLEGFRLGVALSEDGYPRLIRAEKDGFIREAAVEFPD